MREIAHDLAVVPGIIANCYLVGSTECWWLVDAATPGNEKKILRAADARFGVGASPRAIFLTHGHFDHAGSAGRLADQWGVSIYAHPRELPYLTGKAHYPKLNVNAGGFFSFLARFFPSNTVELGKRVREFESAPDGWAIVETPGHTVGHVAFFRPADRTLIAGDAFTTQDLDTVWGTFGKRPKVCRPPAPATFDWESARESVRKLAALRPQVLACGHGVPMTGAADQLQRLADDFPMP